MGGAHSRRGGTLPLVRGGSGSIHAHFIWINREVNPSNKLIAPDAVFEKLDRMAAMNAWTSVTLWFDSSRTTPEQVKASETLAKKIGAAICDARGDRSPVATEFVEMAAHQSSVYFLVDYLRLLIQRSALQGTAFKSGVHVGMDVRMPVWHPDHFSSARRVLHRRWPSLFPLKVASDDLENGLWLANPSPMEALSLERKELMIRLLTLALNISFRRGKAMSAEDGVAGVVYHSIVNAAAWLTAVVTKGRVVREIDLDQEELPVWRVVHGEPDKWDVDAVLDELDEADLPIHIKKDGIDKALTVWQIMSDDTIYTVAPHESGDILTYSHDVQRVRLYSEFGMTTVPKIFINGMTDTRGDYF